jgi:hypothetical protein
MTISAVTTPSRVERSDHAFHSEPAKRTETTPATVDDHRARSMSAHPSLWNRKLVERVDLLHRTALQRASLRHPSDNPTPDLGITLALQGDLNSDSVPYLQGVLHALALLQPAHLSVNLSKVGHVSRESLRLIERSGQAIGGWSLLDPSPSACADLIDLGRSELIESETVMSATAQAQPMIEGDPTCKH